MKCPKCGNTLEDGAIYCKNCGEEIHIVPDFELDLDYVSKMLAKEVMESKQLEILENEASRAAKKRKHIIYLVVCSILIALLIVIGIVFYAYTQTYEYQIKQANSAIEKEDYGVAISYLEKACELDLANIDLRLDLAECYIRSNTYEKYVLILKDIISDDRASKEQQAKAYDKLILFWDSKKEYELIAQLLVNCSLNEVFITHQKYIAMPPEFSFPEGEYESMVPLKLSSNTTGCIYYTVDGSIPTQKEDFLYTAPLFLEAGEHLVSAFFVNEYGLKSEIVTKKYVVELAMPNAPEVDILSGEYTQPTMIEVLEFEDIMVYYTIDGTMPSNQSILYKGPIPMPLGSSIFRFVGYNEDGVAGEITDRNYTLILDTDLTPDTACYDVIKKMIDIGKISDTIGTAVGMEGWYKYQFQYPVTVKEYGNFYVIAEIFQDIAGNREKTGTYYCINILDRAIYKMLKDESGNYLLEGF